MSNISDRSSSSLFKSYKGDFELAENWLGYWESKEGLDQILFANIIGMIMSKLFGVSFLWILPLYEKNKKKSYKWLKLQ